MPACPNRLPTLSVARSRLLPAAFLLLLAACGGGGGGDATPPPPSSGPAISQFAAERAAYFIGEHARVTAVYAGGTGKIEPGSIPVSSGVPLTTPALTGSTTLRLVVSNGTASAERELAIPVSYRERLRTIDMPFARAEHVALPLADGRVLIAGGEDGGTTLPDTTYLFDPSGETFTPAGALSSGRIAFSAVLLADGKVLVSGGLKALSQAPFAEIFDVATGSSVPTATPPRRLRYHATATLLPDGKVLIAGGLTGAGADPTAEIYDPATGAFEYAADTMVVGRVAHTATLIDGGRVLIYGGFTGTGRAEPVELYDPATGSFATLGVPEDTGRGNHAALTAEDGTVWIVGGDDLDGHPLGAVLRFEPATQSFQPVLNLATPRTLFAAGLLNDGRMLATGGMITWSSSEITDTSELGTPNGLRNDGPPMSVHRHLHTVTRLPNGRLLILGGLDRNRSVLASAEIFE